MTQDIIGRLRQVRLDIDKSPDFNSGSTMRARQIVDSVLRVFSNVNSNLMNWTGMNNSNVVDNFGLGGRGVIKNKLTIFTNINTIQNKVTSHRGINPETTKFIIMKLNQIKRM